MMNISNNISMPQKSQQTRTPQKSQGATKTNNTPQAQQSGKPQGGNSIALDLSKLTRVGESKPEAQAAVQDNNDLQKMDPKELLLMLIQLLSGEGGPQAAKDGTTGVQAAQESGGTGSRSGDSPKIDIKQIINQLAGNKEGTPQASKEGSGAKPKAETNSSPQASKTPKKPQPQMKKSA